MKPQTGSKNLHICNAYHQEQITIRKKIKKEKKKSSKKKITQDTNQHFREEEIQLTYKDMEK